MFLPSIRAWICRMMLWGLLASGVGLLVAGQAAQGADNLRKELAAMSKDVAEFLKAEKQSSISVGDFMTLPQLAATATGGKGIILAFEQELQQAGLKVEPLADYGLQGKFEPVDDADSGFAVLSLYVEIVTAKGKVVHALRKRGAFGEQPLADAFGANVNLDPRLGAKERSQQLADSLEKEHRQTATRGTRIAADANSPYAIELLVHRRPGERNANRSTEDDYEARAADVKQGLAFVQVPRDNIYAVRLINDSPHDAAVALSVDGLSMFAFSENKNYTQLTVPARSVALVKGWHRTNDVSDSFLVTEYSQSAAAKLLPSDSSRLGTITVSFSAAWDIKGSPPSDEPQTPSQFSKSADGTGRGPELKAKYVEVQRNFGVIRSVVSVRYSK